MPASFSRACREMLREHLHAWCFARVTRVKVMESAGFY